MATQGLAHRKKVLARARRRRIGGSDRLSPPDETSTGDNGEAARKVSATAATPASFSALRLRPFSISIRKTLC